MIEGSEPDPENKPWSRSDALRIWPEKPTGKAYWIDAAIEFFAVSPVAIPLTAEPCSSLWIRRGPAASALATVFPFPVPMHNQQQPSERHGKHIPHQTARAARPHTYFPGTLADLPPTANSDGHMPQSLCGN